MLTPDQALLVLNGLPTMGPVTLHRLLDRFGGDPVAILHASERSLMSVRGIGPATATAISRWAEHFDLEGEERRLRDRNVGFLNYRDPSYPRLLLQIPDPPIGLYIRGPDRFSAPCVALVGCRRPSPYGQATARKLAGDLARAGIIVVSGLARGIDTAAHRGALDAGGRTVAILGCGMDHLYPPENGRLLEEIAASGTVASEFPFARPPDVQSFPIRNRVVAGLSQVVVVIESDESGGALITAQFALDYNRTVAAVPGRIDQATSAGCHRLIREGALLVRSAGDILEEIGTLPGLTSRDTLPSRSTDGPSPGTSADSAPGNATPTGLSPAEARVFAVIDAEGGLPFDEVAERSSLPSGEVSAALVMLELRRLVERQLDGSYARRN